MSWSKKEFINQAFNQIGYASYEYDLPPEQLQLSLKQLDSMIATWNGKGIYIGYPLPSRPTLSKLDDLTDVPDFANEAIYLNLAIRISPTIGKPVSQDTKTAAFFAYQEMLSNTTKPCEMQFPSTLGRGAGNKTYRYRQVFIYPPLGSISTNRGNIIEFDNCC